MGDRPRWRRSPGLSGLPSRTFSQRSNPLLVYGYGSYGESIDADFSASRLSLLNRGFVYAIAHVRGGGELGQQWYEDGKFLCKKNTFNDYLDVCDALLAQGTAIRGFATAWGAAPAEC